MSGKSQVERLHGMLDERGVSYQTDYLHTVWHVGPKLYDALNNLDGTFTVDCLTPEQVIVATLGAQTAGVAEKVGELRRTSLAFPPNIRRKVNMALNEIEQAIADELNAELGSECAKCLKDIDVDEVYIEKIKPRLIEGTPTEDIRRWSILAHSVMEITGPSTFGADGNVSLWLHENSLTQLLDMCDAVDERFAELGSGTCEYCKDGTFDGQTAMMSNHGWQVINHCPNCGKKIER